MRKSLSTFGILCISLLFVVNGAIAQKSFDNCSVTGCHLIQTKYSEIHEPVEKNCLTCHETKSKTHPNQGKQDFVLKKKTPDLCFTCHEGFNTKKHIHAPVEVGDCLSCHNPHSSENEMLLTAEGGEVCGLYFDACAII